MAALDELMAKESPEAQEKIKARTEEHLNRIAYIEKLREEFIVLADKCGLDTRDADMAYHVDEFESREVDNLWLFIKNLANCDD